MNRNTEASLGVEIRPNYAQKPEERGKMKREDIDTNEYWITENKEMRMLIAKQQLELEEMQKEWNNMIRILEKIVETSNFRDKK